MEGTRWWVAGIAGLLAVAMVVESVGWMAGAGLGVVAAAGILGYRLYRVRRPGKGPSVYCLRCGELLMPTARSCPHCGSASWSVRG